MPLFHTPELILKRRPLAELLAYTVSKLFPNVLLLGGGTTKLGFFYDFIFEQAVHADMLAFIELHLRTLIKENREVRTLSMMRENAQALFLHHHQPFLAEKAGQESQNIIDLIQIDQFYGICPSSSLISTENAGIVKLLDATERKWILPEEEVTVSRLTGTFFENNQLLKQFLKRYDVYLKRKDHRLIAQEMDLFSFSEELSPVEWIWHPKGEIVKQILQEWLEKEQSKAIFFQKVTTPLLIRDDYFKQNHSCLPSFELKDEFCTLSPSRIPQHLYLFKRKPLYFEELPLRFAEYAAVYRQTLAMPNEGMMESFCDLTDQLTTLCLSKQLSKELISSLHFIEQIIRIFDFEAQWYLVASRQSFKARQEKKALEWIKESIQTYSFFYPLDLTLQEEDNLAGPRLELRLIDEIGRQWAGPTLTIPVNHIDMWNLKLEGVEEKDNQPIVLIRSIWGSFNRFIALLIERFEGVFPLWLAPEQIRILPIGESVHSYAKAIETSCKQQGFRIKLDLRPVKLGEKVHLAEKERVPYMLIVGDQEQKKQEITVRSIQQPGKSRLLNLEKFLEQIHQECVCPTLSGSYFEEE